jgi:HD-GYP domain-containing protein (c-di-GMP phosphodiesterase class II)
MEQPKKELSLTVRPETKSQCQTLPKLSNHIFRQVESSLLRDFNQAEPLPVGVWFFYKKEEIFIEFLNSKLYSKERIERLIELSLKYQDFSIFVKISDYEDLAKFISRCKIRSELETHFSLKGQEKLSVLAERVLSSLENTSYIQDTGRYCKELAKATLVTAAEDRNVFNTLLNLHTIDNAFIAHSLATSFITAKICKNLEISNSEIESIALSAILHDIGYFYIDKTLISKRKSVLLSGDENKEFLAHASRGKDVIEKINSIGGKIPTVVGVVCSQHHERMNGSGYPNKLRGTQESKGSEGIHFYSRVVSLADEFCDAFDLSKNVDKALAYIKNNRDYFDPLLIKALFDSLSLKKEGGAA